MASRRHMSRSMPYMGIRLLAEASILTLPQQCRRLDAREWGEIHQRTDATPRNVLEMLTLTLSARTLGQCSSRPMQSSSARLRSAWNGGRRVKCTNPFQRATVLTTRHGEASHRQIRKELKRPCRTHRQRRWRCRPHQCPRLQHLRLHLSLRRHHHRKRLYQLRLLQQLLDKDKW